MHCVGPRSLLAWSGIAVWFVLGSALACGSPSRKAPQFSVSESQIVMRGSETALHPRCNGYAMASVPATYDAFEAEILAWIATCVTSRSDQAHREDALVRGNQSLAALWRQVTPGQRIHIVPRYVWSEAGLRVEQIEFSLASQASAQGASPPGHSAKPPSSPDAAPGHSVAPPGPGRSGPGPASKGTPRRQIQPPMLRGILDDARAVVRWLRKQGALKDARKLAALIDTAAPYATDVAMLVGAYYFAVKFRAGKLLFLWGWNAAGPRFARSAARLERLLPRAERAVADVVDEVGRVSRRHPRLAGSGIDWDVLDQVIDPSVPAQLDDMACGPACAQLALQDRGIKMSQAQLIQRARRAMPAEIKSRMITPKTIANLLQKFDPRGGWTDDLDALLKRTRNARQIFNTLNKRGPWIAQVDTHLVYVEGLDSTGHVWLRDPWYEPGIERGVRVGSRYRVTLQTFVQHWIGVAVYRQ